MQDTFSIALIGLTKKLGAGWIFFICLSVMALYAIVEFIFAILKRGSVKLYASHFILLFAVSVTDIALSCFCDKSDNVFIYPFILLGVGIALFIPTFIVKDRKKKATYEQKKFVQFLDSKIESEREEIKEKEEDGVRFLRPKDFFIDKKPVENKPIEKTENIDKNINFSHVKNVLEKMDCINLSPVDVLQVNDLKTNLYLAENGGVDITLKEKINDGLGALLKIMAKYSV